MTISGRPEIGLEDVPCSKIAVKLLQWTFSGRPCNEQPTSRGCPQDQFTDHHLTTSDVLWMAVRWMAV